MKAYSCQYIHRWIHDCPPPIEEAPLLNVTSLSTGRGSPFIREVDAHCTGQGSPFIHEVDTQWTYMTPKGF